MKPASPQDTFDHVFGSGALSYEWWLRADYHIDERGKQSADDWAVDVTADNGNGGTVTVMVDHKLIMKTARYVLDNKGKLSPARPNGTQTYPAWSKALERECQRLVLSADDADFDADIADELLQLAVLGEVVFG